MYFGKLSNGRITKFRSLNSLALLTLVIGLQGCTQINSPTLQAQKSTTIEGQASQSAFRPDNVKLLQESRKLRQETLQLQQEAVIARQKAAIEAHRQEVEKWRQIWLSKIEKLDNERKKRLGIAVEETDAKKVEKVAIVAPHSIQKKPTPVAKKKPVVTKKVSKAKKPVKQKRVANKNLSGKAKYDRLIRKHARANGVPVRLAHAVVRIESSYRAKARGAVGEIGLMQVRLSTARGMGYRGSAKGLYDPETNIKYGMRYLGKAYKLGGGKTCGAILKYNAGHGAKRMNPTSAKYCRRVKQYI